MDWKPIETAPKNQRDILLIRQFGAICYAPMVAAWFEDGWYSQQYPDEKITEAFTHWQPLPEPPTD